MQGTPGSSAGRLKRHRDDGAGPANGGLEDDDDLREPGPASAVRLQCPLSLRPGQVGALCDLQGHVRVFMVLAGLDTDLHHFSLFCFIFKSQGCSLMNGVEQAHLRR